MNWYKYRHRWSSRNSEFFYTERDEKDWESVLLLIMREYDWSEKYHGVTWEIVKAPPKKWIKEQIPKIEKQIISLQDQIVGCEQRISRYKEMLKK